MKYTTPICEVEAIETADVITTSVLFEGVGYIVNHTPETGEIQVDIPDVSVLL